MSTPPTLNLEYLDAKIKFIKEFVSIRPFLRGKKLTTHISPEETVALLEAMRSVLLLEGNPHAPGQFNAGTFEAWYVAREAFRKSFEEHQ